MTNENRRRCILFDWGDTLMRVFPEYAGPMFTWPRVEAMPQVQTVLAELRPQAVLAVATNAADSQVADIWAALARVELAQALDKVYCYQQLGYRKPAPAFFARILADLQLAPSQAIMVGDDFEVDVRGANQCGLRAIWYNWRTAEQPAGAMFQTIQDWRALPQAVALFWKTPVS